jgi:competence protein ComEA
MKLHRVVAFALAVMFGVLVSSGVVLAAAQPAPEGKVNLNTASVEQLATLPGVGEKLAARIVEYRQKAGTFKSIQELMNVKGIGERNLEKLQPYLSLGEPAGKGSASR